MHFGFNHNICGGFHYLSVPSFDETGLVRVCFTTRAGGFSKPPLHTMNLGFGRGDSRDDVLKNYATVGDGVSMPIEKLVAFTQVHRDDICVADASFAGEAFSPQKREYDGVITATQNLPIGTYHADCIPVFLLDPVRRVIGAAHAGWRGTVLKTPARAVDEMVKSFGSSPDDILAAIGPGIGKCCFETKEDVPDAVLDAYGNSSFAYISQHDERFHVDLAGLCARALLDVGIPDKNITLSGECTCCRSELYWSHRKTGGVRGCMLAAIMLR